MNIPESVWSALISTAARVTVIVGIAWIAILCARRWSPSQRHCVWAACLMGALVLPLAAGLLPAWTLAVMPQQPQIPAQTIIQHGQPISAPEPGKTYENPRTWAKPQRSISERSAGIQAPPDRQPQIVLQTAPEASPVVSTPKPDIALNWGAIAAGIWLIGFGVLILRLCLGLISIQIAGGRCRELDLAGSGLVPDGMVVKIGLDSSSRYPSVPLTYGVFKPVILLPYGAENWPKERLNAAIAHEIAHIRRHDWILQILAYVSCSLYWYHPLVWLASRRMRGESELACDDLAMESGIAPADYAMHLLDVARSASQMRYGAAAVAMAQTSKIEARLTSILAPERRRGAVTRAVLVVLVLTAAVITVPMAVIRLAAKTVDSVENWNGIQVTVHAKGDIDTVDGGYVRLAGISDSATENSGWWATDGTPVVGTWPQGFVGSHKPSGLPGRDIALDVNMPIASQPEVKIAPSTLGENSLILNDTVDMGGSRYVRPDITWLMTPDNRIPRLSHIYGTDSAANGEVDGRFAIQFAVPAGTRTGEVMIGVASGPWTETIDCPMPKNRTTIYTKSGDVRFTVDSNTKSSKRLFLTVADHLGVGYYQRFRGPFDQDGIVNGNCTRKLYCLDRSGDVIAEIGFGSVATHDSQGGETLLEAYITPALLRQTTTLRLVARPYKWVEFKNVAMQPVSQGRLATVTDPLPKHNNARISGVIQDESGKPVAGANIILDEIIWKDGQSILVDQQHAGSSADGSFSIVSSDSDRRRYLDFVYATNSDGIALPTGPEWGNFKNITLRLSPLTRLRVHLIDKQGSPVAGLRVAPSSLGTGQFGFWPEADNTRCSGVTDANGWATLDGLPQGGSASLDVIGDEYTFAPSSANIILAHSAETPDATITLLQVGSISGRVTGGKLNASVGTVAVLASSAHGLGDGQTDSNGNFTIRKLYPGRFKVQVNSRVINGQGLSLSDMARMTMPVWVNVSEGKTTAGVSLPIIAGGIIRGTVRDVKTGAPLVGIYVAESGSSSSFMAQTDANGQYTMQVLPGRPMLYIFNGDAIRNSEKTVEITDGQVKVVDFSIVAPPKRVSVRGIVVGPDGKPVPNATVVAVGDWWPETDSSIKADSQGRFSFNNSSLAPPFDTRDMTADRVLYASSGSMRSPAGVPVRDGGAFTLRVASTALATVHGRVVDPDGTPVPGINVTCYRQTQIGLGFPEGQTVSDANGDFTLIPTVVSGRFLIQAASGQDYQFTAPIPAIGIHPGQHIEVGNLVGDFDYSADDYDNMSVSIAALNWTDNSGKSVWSGPRGETLAAAPKYWPQSFPQAFRTQPGMKEVTFAVVVNDPGQTGRLGNLSWKAEVDGNACSVTTIPLPRIAALGPRLHYAIHVLMPADAEKCTLHVNGGQVWDVHTLDAWYRTSGASPWQSAGFNDGHLYFMLNPDRGDSSVVIHSLAFDPNTMAIFAVDNKGKDINPVPNSIWVGTDKSRTMPRPIAMAEFGVKPSQIKEVIVESNPHQWESIRDIHLQ